MNCKEIVVITFSFIGCAIFVGHGIRSCFINDNLSKVDVEPIEAISIER